MAHSDEYKRKLLKELNESPIIEMACRKAGIHRSTYYRWLHEDADFEEAAFRALDVSGSRISDLAESQLISLIQEKDFKSIIYWLSRRHPGFAAQPIKRRQPRGLIDPVAAILRNYGLLNENKKKNRFL